MESDSWVLNFIVFMGFLILSAIFSSSETAFTATGKAKLRSLIDRNAKGAKEIETLLKRPRKLLTAILIGNNITNVAASVMATAFALKLVESVQLSLATKMTLVTFVMTVLLLIFGEITPKTLVIKNPEKWAATVSKPLAYFVRLSSPLVWVFHGISKLIARIFRIDYESVDSALTAEELKTLVKISEEEGVLEKEEQEMIDSIFGFSDTVVREIMTPRTDAVCISIDETVDAAVNLIMEKGHSRIPVYEEKIDNIMGIVYAKDLLIVNDQQGKESLKKYIREAIFIPETKNIEELLRQMRNNRFHLAIVVDEYGGMSGIVTLEDIIEEIIGEIQDEYDVEEPAEVNEVRPGEYLVDARINIEDLGAYLNVRFPVEEDFDTLGGFVLSLLGNFPTVGEKVHYQGYDIVVKDVDKQRIRKLEIVKIHSELSEEADPVGE